MPITLLEIEHFRSLSKAKLDFDSRLNLIVGPNGAGKTSILESVYYLAAGHSFKSTPLEMIIQSQKPQFSLCGRITDPFGIPAILGVSGSASGHELHMDGKLLRGISDFARRFPVQVIDPEIHRLVADGPTRRRRYIDWGVFHVEQSFHEAWRRFNRALKQRNAALKIKSRAAASWNLDIATQGTVLTNLREGYLNELKPFVFQIGRRLLGQDVDLSFQRGWRRELNLMEALEESRERDAIRCSTGVGPQRAELFLTLGGVPAKERVSRGQQKLLACVLLLAQQLHRMAIGAPSACLLMDDPAAELDVDNVDRLLDVVTSLQVQLIITSLSKARLNSLKHAKMFHVEHGNVEAMA